MLNRQMEKLIIIVGPTGAGKTGTAIELALRLDGEIISADSRYFYRGMDIGTAKPTHEEMRTVRHHLIDVTDLDHIWNLALFQQEAIKLIHEINDRGKLPFLVGGTGQYIRSITEGWRVPEQEPDDALRKVLEAMTIKMGDQNLHAWLKLLDPAAAETIDYRNVRRTVRALEVIFKTGHRFSEQRTKNGSPYHVIMLGIQRSRHELYARIDARIERMIQDGFVEEVRGLLAQGYDLALQKIAAIGYVEIAQHIKGEISLEEAIRLIKRKTRIFVRRQANWFKPTDPNITWFKAGDEMIDAMEETIRSMLSE